MGANGIASLRARPRISEAHLSPLRPPRCLTLKPRDQILRTAARHMPQLPLHGREIAGGQVPAFRQVDGRRQAEEALERARCTRPPEWGKIQLEHESSRCGRIEPVRVVGGGDHRQGVAIEPGQHLVHVSRFPTVTGRGAIEKQRIHLVEQQHLTPITGLGERLGDLSLGPADPAREQIGGPLDRQRPIDRTGEMVRQRRLARSRRPGETPPAPDAARRSNKGASGKLVSNRSRSRSSAPAGGSSLPRSARTNAAADRAPPSASFANRADRVATRSTVAVSGARSSSTSTSG